MNPPITIACTTWLPPGHEELRAEAVYRAVRSWHQNLKHDTIHLHVADDGSDPKQFQQLMDSLLWNRGLVTTSVQLRHGVGASLNAAIKQASESSSLILHAVDDWEITEEFDLSVWSQILLNTEDVGMVRFFPHPDLTGKIRGFREVTPTYYSIELDRHHFAFATRPFLAHQRFFDAYGLFKEDVTACQAEQDYNQRFCLEIDKPKILLALSMAWNPIDSIALSDVMPGWPI